MHVGGGVGSGFGPGARAGARAVTGAEALTSLQLYQGLVGDVVGRGQIVLEPLVLG